MEKDTIGKKTSSKFIYACDCQSRLGDFVKRNPHATFDDLEHHQKELDVWAKKCSEKYPNYEKSAVEWEPYTHLCEQGK